MKTQTKATRYGSLRWGQKLKAEIWTTGYDEEILTLVAPTGGHYPIAAMSWHVDVDGLITCPPNGPYRKDWLADVGGGYVLPGTALATKVENWLAKHNDELIALFGDPERNWAPILGQLTQYLQS